MHESVGYVSSRPFEGANGRDRRVANGEVTTVCGLVLKPKVIIVKDTAMVKCPDCRRGAKS